MNVITVVGGTPSRKVLAMKTVQHMCKVLMPRVRSLDIEVRITKNYVGKTGMEASHLELDTHREHYIEVDAGLGMCDFVTALCHEMVHAKQSYRKELTQRNNKMFWKGRDCTDVDYMNQPWEKEAYQLQDELALDIWKNVL